MTNIEIRNLSSNDYGKHYLDLLEQLTCVNKEIIDYNKFNEFVNKLNKNHIIFVCEDVINNKIIATGTLIIEPKLIHGCSYVGHIEDIVVDNQYGGQNYGKLIITKLIEYAKNNDCYKVILDCNDNVQKFYEKCGFHKKENQMIIYF